MNMAWYWGCEWHSVALAAAAVATYAAVHFDSLTTAATVAADAADAADAVAVSLARVEHAAVSLPPLLADLLEMVLERHVQDEEDGEDER